MACDVLLFSFSALKTQFLYVFPEHNMTLTNVLECVCVFVCVCVCRSSRPSEGVNVGLEFLLNLLVFVLSMLLLDGVEVRKELVKVNAADQLPLLSLALLVFEKVSRRNTV